ncbi:MAG: hypothetical protein SFV53_05860 [Rickettsiales bacterium]|nr:hypothetical protein [Rickettsiales bacterium]
MRIGIKDHLKATLRAIVSDNDLQIEFDFDSKNNFFSWDQNLISDRNKVILPQIQSDEIISEKNLSQRFRAAFDMVACYLLFHDSKIHQLKNYSEDEQKIFDEFEKVRLISQVKNFYLGSAKNLLHKIEDDILSGSTNLSLILLKEIFSEKYLQKNFFKTYNFAKDLEKNLSKKVLSEVKKLLHKTSNQADFAAAIDKILELLRQEKEINSENSDQEKSQNLDNKNDKIKNDLKSFGQENIDSKNEENFSQNQIEQESEKIIADQKISDFQEDDQKGNVSLKLDEVSDYADKIEFKNLYKIYTSKFDEIIFPQKLIAKKELEILRDQLDLRINKLTNISKKMTLKLKKKLLSKRNSFLEYDASRGVLNRKKLTRLVIDPFIEEIWINNKNHEYHDTVLTILLDNSGSMRGNPIVMSALACEIIAAILEKFAIKTEIIGFTTADWKGGKARKLWESSGRPKNPGRLNELRHIIYKHFNQKFKKSKINLGLMLKEGILKENIDGEALLFARARLMQQSEKRKILMVISDGTPVDDSTNSANDSDILSDHLHHVINKIENSAKIEIVGIGIGHTIEEFYRNSIAIKSLEELGDVMIEKIVALL